MENQQSESMYPDLDLDPIESAPFFLFAIDKNGRQKEGGASEDELVRISAKEGWI